MGCADCTDMKLRSEDVGCSGAEQAVAAALAPGSWEVSLLPSRPIGP